MIITSAYTDNPLVKYTTPNKEEYCDRYDYVCEMQQHDYKMVDWERDHGKSYGFFRIKHLLDLCNEYMDGEWIMWMDCDTLIMNHNTDICQFLDNNYDMIIGEDWNGINTGVFFVRISERIKRFLTEVLAFTPTALTQAQYPDWWTVSEQCAIYHLHQTIKTKVVHHSLFNGYPFGPYDSNDWRHAGLGPINPNWKPQQFQVGDFVLHLASGNMDFKLCYLQQYLPAVIK